MMKLCFQQFTFLLRKLGWKVLLLLAFLWVFYSSSDFMIQWNGEYIDIVASDNKALYYWFICIFIIGAVSILLLYSIYRYKTRWMLIQGNRLAYIWADILFLMVVFILWYVMFMRVYYSYSIQGLALNEHVEKAERIAQAVQMFYLYLPKLPLMGQLFPYTIKNIMRYFLFILFICSCIEYIVLVLIKEKQKLLEVIYLVIVFVLSWYILMNIGFLGQIAFYIGFFIVNIIGSKKTWMKKKMGG